MNEHNFPILHIPQTLCSFNPPSPTSLRDYFPRSANSSSKSQVTGPDSHSQDSKEGLSFCCIAELRATLCFPLDSSLKLSHPRSLWDNRDTCAPQSITKGISWESFWGHRFRMELRLLPSFDLGQTPPLSRLQVSHLPQGWYL